MFMIEKSLIIIIFVYASGIAILGGQYIWADVFHITMTNFQGQPLKNNILTDININTINNVGGSLVTNSTATVSTVDYLGIIANIGIDLFLLASGLYIFDILAQLGVPIIFIVGFVVLYLFLLIRSVLGWARGI